VVGGWWVGDRCMLRQGLGTFVVRASSNPGKFAMSVVTKKGSCTHFIIKNQGDAGYCFAGRKEHFPSLQVRHVWGGHTKC